jgi:translin
VTASGASALDGALRGILEELAQASAARERALPLCRSATRHAANCIRAAHRGHWDAAEALLGRARADAHAAADALRAFPAVYHAGFLHDAQKEYAEAAITLALVRGRALGGAHELGVEGVAFLHGAAEAVGELRRHALDLLRADAVDAAERALELMEELFGLLVEVDYPDALTAGLRRAADVARSLVERTRGDVTLAVQQRRLLSRLLEAGPD